MQRTRPRIAAIPIAGYALGALLFPAVSLAQPELDTVREMLRLDTEQALAQERARQPSPTRPAAVAPVARTDRIAVSAIYGMSGKRTVVLYVNGDRKEYREGVGPVRGDAKSTTDYRLVDIEESCVHLAKAGGRSPRVACFSATPAAGLGLASGMRPTQILSPPLQMGMPIEAHPASQPAR